MVRVIEYNLPENNSKNFYQKFFCMCCMHSKITKNFVNSRPCSCIKGYFLDQKCLCRTVLVIQWATAVDSTSIKAQIESTRRATLNPVHGHCVMAVLSVQFLPKHCVSTKYNSTCIEVSVATWLFFCIFYHNYRWKQKYSTPLTFSH